MGRRGGKLNEEARVKAVTEHLAWEKLSKYQAPMSLSFIHKVSIDLFAGLYKGTPHLSLVSLDDLFFFQSMPFMNNLASCSSGVI